MDPPGGFFLPAPVSNSAWIHTGDFFLLVLVSDSVWIRTGSFFDGSADPHRWLLPAGERGSTPAGAQENEEEIFDVLLEDLGKHRIEAFRDEGCGFMCDLASTTITHNSERLLEKEEEIFDVLHEDLGKHRVDAFRDESDCFYIGGWTENARVHDKYSKTPLFCIGTSIGANIVVKYLGEEGKKTPVAGVVSICSPWDLLDNGKSKGDDEMLQPQKSANVS